MVLSVGDVVCVELKVEEFKQLQQGQRQWTARLEEVLLIKINLLFDFHENQCLTVVRGQRLKSSFTDIVSCISVNLHTTLTFDTNEVGYFIILIECDLTPI